MMMSGSMFTTLLPHVGHIDVKAGCTVLHSHCGQTWDRHKAFRAGIEAGYCCNTDYNIFI